MKKWLFAGATFLMSMQAFGYQALAPIDQTAREINDILNSREVRESFPNGVRAIVQTPGGFDVSSDLGVLHVDVLRFGPEKYGPVQYKLRFHEMDRTIPDNFG
ncbi:MAG: hypothetical protein P0S95_07265 [Rhabdochlamydiaceae bacterium]|nr:hypothetical protein [Candidatus Amphrikana amoebophyrae]